MQPDQRVNPISLAAMKLVDFGQLQARYQALGLSQRAGSVLADAQPALEAAERIMQALAAHPNGKTAFSAIRKSSVLISRMRSSEAKTLLLDSSDDFIDSTRRKLAAWCKTMQRIGQGEDIAKDGGGKEFIPASAPLALAIAGSSGLSNYLSIIQLVLGELAKTDAAHAPAHNSAIAELRRCATLLADCEHASGIQTVVH